MGVVEAESAIEQMGAHPPGCNHLVSLRLLKVEVCAQYPLQLAFVWWNRAMVGCS